MNFFWGSGKRFEKTWEMVHKTEFRTFDWNMHNCTKQQVEEMLPSYIESEMLYGENVNPTSMLIELISIKSSEKYPEYKDHKSIAMVDLEVRLTYSYPKYLGERYGKEKVYEVEASEIYFDTPPYLEAMKFVSHLIPDAVRRVGCMCCYGSGPDIDTEWNEKTKKLEIWVNFDFRLDEGSGL